MTEEVGAALTPSSPRAACLKCSFPTHVSLDDSCAHASRGADGRAAGPALAQTHSHGSMTSEVSC